MKRLGIALFAATLVLAMSASAFAEVVVKAKGEFAVSANWINNFDLNSGQGGNIDSTDDFAVYERARIDFRFVANENLEGVFYIEYGTASWGDPQYMAIGKSDAGSIGVKRAYISFRWPDTDVLFSIGKQNLALPSAYSGGWILNNDVTAAVVSSPITDMFAVTAGYVRAYDFASTRGVAGNDQPNAGGRAPEELDLGFIAVPITPEGINFTPYFMYGYAGSNTTVSSGLPDYIAGGLMTPNSSGYEGQGANLYWAGAALTVEMFDPIVVMADFVWGQKTSSIENLRRDGWFMDFAVQYTGLDFMTPELVFAYGSGEDDDPSNGSERMPGLSNDGSWSVGTYFFGDSALLESDMGGTNDQFGFWTIGIQLKDISFIEKLSHTLSVLYVQGTNDHGLLEDNADAAGIVGYTNGITYGRTLFDKDSLWEVDFNHQYQIYEELSAVLELSWIYANFDEDTWNKVDSSYGGVQQSWKCAFGALYEF